ncbi:MAG: transposase [Chloroflexi bacterium]|nr:transposase [Chloroflexota bacterium]
MCDLPTPILSVLAPFALAFSSRVWPWAMVLLVGAILAPGQRTVASVLRVMGLQAERQFQKYHRVLNRDRWSSLQLGRALLLLVDRTFLPAGVRLLIGLDDTVERRRGAKIAARGISRDPVRSSKEFFVKTSSLRWVSLQALVPIPWAQRVWALPFLTVLAPSERYHQERGRRSSDAVLELLHRCARLAEPITVVSRLRLDARWFDPAPERTPGTPGRPPVKGKRQPTLGQRLQDPSAAWQAQEVRWYGGVRRAVELATGTAVWYHPGLPPVPVRWTLVRDPLGKFASQGLLCTDLTVSAPQMVEWFVLRWQVEVTVHEVRDHLGGETQRQWSDLAILRTTPALLGLFSLVTVMAHHLLQQGMPLRTAAWYTKPLPTFVHALALVRQELWPVRVSCTSAQPSTTIEIPQALWQRITNTLAYAA